MVPFKALLVEGTSGVGKSTLLDALIRRHVESSTPRKIRTLVHLAQSHTYGPLAIPEDNGTLTADENLRHLERIVGMIEWLHTSVQEHTRPWCFVLVDTLYLTHCVRPGVVKWNDVEPYDRRLAAVGCKLLFLQGTPATIGSAESSPGLTSSSYRSMRGNSDELTRISTAISFANRKSLSSYFRGLS
jgi:hypothetical protein